MINNDNMNVCEIVKPKNDENMCFDSLSIVSIILHHLYPSCLQGGGPPRPTPTPFWTPSTLAVRKKHHVISMFAMRNVYTDHVVCTWEGLPPPPIAFFTTSTLDVAKKRRVISMRDGYTAHSACKSGGGGPRRPNPRAFFSRPSMLDHYSLFRTSSLFSIVFRIVLHY